MRSPVIAALALVLSACSSTGYEPRSDEELFQAIAELPGVKATNSMDSTTGFQEGTGYSGYITLEPTADPATVIDATLAILWQGRKGAEYGLVEWLKDGKGYRESDVGLIDEADYEARYGEQPGTGVPPTDKPALQLLE